MQPAAGVVFDLAGNLYGTNTGGTALTGTVFQLQPPSQSGGDWTETVLHTFTDGPDGGWPTGTLMRGKLAFYGTTFAGGDSICNCGVVFAVTR